jgi:hypothetical protein
MQIIRIVGVLLLALAAGVTPAAAVLVDRGNGLIYDSNLNVTWLEDANFAQSSGFDVDGRMMRNDAVAWVDALEFAGYSDWRLPRNSGQVHNGVLPAAGGELGSLFHFLGNASGSQFTETGPFMNVRSQYWLANEPAPPPPAVPPSTAYDGYAFSADGGYEYPSVGDNLVWVWPVRSGDVTPQMAFTIPDVIVYSDGVNPTQGTINAVLNLDGIYVEDPPSISSFNVAFELAGHPPGAAFGTPQDPTSNSLIPLGNAFSGASALPHTIRFAKDALSPTMAVDGGVMVTVPFTIAAGVTNQTFAVNFTPGNELTDPDALPLSVAYVGGSITVLPLSGGLAGDYNHNGVVDAADYVVWRRQVGQSGTGLAADGDGDGAIDIDDYQLWRTNFGRSSSTATSTGIVSAPEPTTLLLLAAACSVRRRMRRHTRSTRNSSRAGRLNN